MVMGEFTKETEVLVIGAGPGGYAAAFRAADLGLDVTLVDADGKPGGTCVHRGCIPSKTLLYHAGLIHEVGKTADAGISFARPDIDLDKFRKFKSKVTADLCEGLEGLAKKRKIELIHARAVFEDSSTVRLTDNKSEYSRISYKHAVLAPGSRPASLPGAKTRMTGRIMDSKGALALLDIPETLLVVGGGYIGLEMGSVYAALGSRVTVVEAADRLLAAADRDLVRVLAGELEGFFENIHLETRVEDIEEREDDAAVVLEGEDVSGDYSYQRVLIAVGRLPNTGDIGLENTDARTDDAGFIRVDEHRRTDDERIYAVGDAASEPMLAHKAMHEGKTAAEHIAGRPAAYDQRAVPAVVYTFPEVAWCGLTEQQAAEQDIEIDVSRFNWAASGRAASMGLARGMTKIVVEPRTGRVLGVGIAGRDAGEMIAEGVLAVEMGALAEDVARTMHPHPTLSEGILEAAGAYEGYPTHVLPRKER